MGACERSHPATVPPVVWVHALSMGLVLCLMPMSAIGVAHVAESACGVRKLRFGSRYLRDGCLGVLSVLCRLACWLCSLIAGDRYPRESCAASPLLNTDALVILAESLRATDPDRRVLSGRKFGIFEEECASSSLADREIECDWRVTSLVVCPRPYESGCDYQ